MSLHENEFYRIDTRPVIDPSIYQNPTELFDAQKLVSFQQHVDSASRVINRYTLSHEEKLWLGYFESVNFYQSICDDYTIPTPGILFTSPGNIEEQSENIRNLFPIERWEILQDLIDREENNEPALSELAYYIQSHVVSIEIREKTYQELSEIFPSWLRTEGENEIDFRKRMRRTTNTELKRLGWRKDTNIQQSFNVESIQLQKLLDSEEGKKMSSYTLAETLGMSRVQILEHVEHLRRTNVLPLTNSEETTHMTIIEEVNYPLPTWFRTYEQINKKAFEKISEEIRTNPRLYFAIICAEKMHNLSPAQKISLVIYDLWVQTIDIDWDSDENTQDWDSYDIGGKEFEGYRALLEMSFAENESERWKRYKEMIDRLQVSNMPLQPLTEFEFCTKAVYNSSENFLLSQKEIARSKLSEFKQEKETWKQFETRILLTLKRKLYPLGEVEKGRNKIRMHEYEKQYLELIKNFGHITQSEAVQRMGISTSLVVRIRSDLNEKGLLESYQNANPATYNIRDKIITTLELLMNENPNSKISYTMIAEASGEPRHRIKGFMRFHGKELNLPEETKERFSFKI